MKFIEMIRTRSKKQWVLLVLWLTLIGVLNWVSSDDVWHAVSTVLVILVVTTFGVAIIEESL